MTSGGDSWSFGSRSRRCLKQPVYTLCGLATGSDGEGEKMTVDYLDQTLSAPRPDAGSEPEGAAHTL